MSGLRSGSPTMILMWIRLCILVRYHLSIVTLNGGWEIEALADMAVNDE